MTGPFSIQSEEHKAVARHCSIGIEPRISAECITLLDTQVQVLSLPMLIGNRSPGGYDPSHPISDLLS
ncbi:hypothetical protein P8452_07514 [Trifolium repens]|nr:hypothetical protein P8452_07514 [Trifolium repens]